MSERRYLSIGEVLGLLLEEFPDITISKIRFLESQGLIDPERTPSGYRKFYDVDVERLRVILREQRENFLPLKVIKDRLDSGELVGDRDTTPTGGIRLPRPRGAAWFDQRGGVDITGTVVLDASAPAGTPRPAVAELMATQAVSTPVAAPVVATPVVAAPVVAAPVVAAPVVAAPAVAVPVAPLAPLAPVTSAAAGNGGRTDDELCALAGIERTFLAELEDYGLVTGRQLGALRIYDDDAVQAVVAAAGLCQRGLQPRHLRQWRTTVDKEMALIEQLVLPLMRQRNPQAREHASDVAHDIDALGCELREALARSALRNLVG